MSCIYVVEDDKNIREIETFALTNTGYEVEGFDCPAIEELPIALTCKVFDIVPLGCHDMFMADIVNVSVDPKMLDGEKLCINRAHLCAYAHGEYYKLGARIGKFGFSVKKKTKK